MFSRYAELMDTVIDREEPEISSEQLISEDQIWESVTLAGKGNVSTCRAAFCFIIVLHANRHVSCAYDSSVRGGC